MNHPVMNMPPATANNKERGSIAEPTETKASQTTQTPPSLCQPEHQSKPAPVWVGLHFSQIALISAVSTRNSSDHPVNHPLVVVELHQNQSRVYAANEKAQAQGVEKGCLLNAAYVLCRHIEVIVRDQAAELALLKCYTKSVARFTPQIVLSGSDTLLLEVRHSLRLFGGFKALMAQLKLTFPGVLLHIACAPVAAVAELMARNHIQKMVSHQQHLQSALGSISLYQTTISPALIHQLERCGLSCLRDAWRLPRADLARRFGPDLLYYLDVLSGSVASPQLIFTTEHGFRAEHDFEQETENTAVLLHAAEALLQRAQQFLQTRALLCEKLNFHFVYTHRRGEVCQRDSLSVYAQQGGDTVAHFLPQLEEHIQRFIFNKAVIGIKLHIDQFKPRQDSTLDLFRGTRENTQSWPMLLDILAARLGKKALYCLFIQADHRPEKGWGKRNAGMRADTTSQRFSLPPSRPPRPVWLLSEPLKQSDVGFFLLSGAERLESGWWSGKDLRREYYRGISPSGRHCWLFRDLKAEQEQWYLHGLFG